MDREAGVEANLVGVFAKQTRADAVERAGPSQAIRHHAGVISHDLSRDPLDALCHLGSSTA